LKDLEIREVKFGLVGVRAKKEFRRENKESVKVDELKKVEQRGKIMKEFIQGFRRAARRSRYERRALVKEFKREMNGVIKRKLMKAKRPQTSIEQ